MDLLLAALLLPPAGLVGLLVIHAVEMRLDDVESRRGQVTPAPATWQVGKDDEVDVALADDTTRAAWRSPRKACRPRTRTLRTPARLNEGQPPKGLQDWRPSVPSQRTALPQ